MQWSSIRGTHCYVESVRRKRETSLSQKSLVTQVFLLRGKPLERFLSGRFGDTVENPNGQLASGDFGGKKAGKEVEDKCLNQ